MILKGDVPSPINPPSGCRFHTRCPFVFDRCRTEVSKSRDDVEGGLVSSENAVAIYGFAG
jgi:peptide/nickel transport system ATP-binding protein